MIGTLAFVGVPIAFQRPSHGRTGGSLRVSHALHIAYRRSHSYVACAWLIIRVNK